MTTTNNNAMVPGVGALKFTNKNKAEWDAFRNKFRDFATLHKEKLDTVAFDNQLHRTIKKKISADIKAELAGADPAVTGTRAVRQAVDAELAEVLREHQETAFSLLMSCICDTNLDKKLRREHDRDAYKAITYIESTWAVDGNDTRINSTVAERKDHIEGGLTKVDATTVTAFGERLIQFNAELDGTDHEMKDGLIVTTVLDALAAAGGSAFIGFVRNFKANNSAVLKDYNRFIKVLEADLEENDRMEREAATRTQREAMSVLWRCMQP